jgi:hypothetical protein
MSKNKSIDRISLLAVCTVLTALLPSQSVALAASAKFTASAPPGGTNFPSLVNYSLTKTGGDNFSNAIDFPADVSGNNVVSEMNFQMENFSNSSFDGSVSGNMMTVQDISSAAASGGGGGLDVWVDLDTMLDPCTNCVLDVDFTIPFKPSLPFRTVMLLAAGPVGQSVPIQSDGTLSLALEFADDPVSPTRSFTLESTWSFNPSMTTADLIRAIDTTLASTAFPRDILHYEGLVDGFPTIGHDLSQRIISFRSTVETLELAHVGFQMGVAMLGVIPEPASGTLALLSLTMLGHIRVKYRRHGT